jgi:zinc protease
MNQLYQRVSACVGLVLLVLGVGQGPSTASAGDARADRAAVGAAAALYEGIRTETLPNGLRIYLKPIPGSPVVTTMVAYKVGSADEDTDHTGLSHYLEHLMFKGTDRLMPGDVDRMTLRNGGQNNAYTSEDYTVYHFDFAADRWEAALAVEADRMRHLRIDARHEFEQEKGAVIEELQRDEDQPFDLEEKAILPLLFGARAPYGHPVIGERQHVRGATADVIHGYYERWYYPNNAALVICGGFDSDKALETVRRLFGPLPRGTLPERKSATPVARDKPVLKEIDSKFDIPRMVMGFNTVRTGAPGYYALEVLQALLTGGKTGRLYKKLVEGAEIATGVESSNSSGRYPGWFAIRLELLKGADRNQGEELVLKELQRLSEEAVSPAELERAKQGILAGTIFARESVHRLADSIARGVTTNDLEYLKTYLPRIAAVTAQDVQAAARQYFRADARVVVWSIPKPATGARRPERRETLTEARREHARRRADAAAGGGAFSLESAQRHVLDNGLVLLLLENHRLPIVVAEAHVGQVRLHEPEAEAGVAALTGRLLDEGTSRHSGPAIAESIENVGGSLTLGANGGSVRVLTPDRRLGLGLLFECLSQATFPEKEFKREQQRLLSEIDDAERQPETKAAMTYEALVYGKHPYGRPSLGRHNTVAALSPGQCAAFYRNVFTPNNTIVAIVGDFDSKQVLGEVKEFTANWKQGSALQPQVPEITKPTAFTQKILTMPSAVQLHFYMGHPGIRRSNPDYYKLLVMDYVLGTGPGFTDRLSARLRDREGLAYTVSANISSSASDQPGTFTCYIGTDPQNFARVKGEFLEELARLRSEKPRAEEVEDAKRYLLGSLPFQFTTNERMAGQLLLTERYHLGLDYVKTYRKAVENVTPEDVHEVASRYLDPEHMVLVAAGAVDAQGKALKQLPPPQKGSGKP